MATIKSYTDINQSRKLAEILPLESADMWYQYIGGSGLDNILYIPVYVRDDPSEIDIPCWSLAALLDVLPKRTRLLKSATDDTYHCDCPKGNIDEWFDNPVDACYEMIIKIERTKSTIV